MINFLLLMLVPIGIAIFSILYFKGKVTLAEFGAQLAVPAVCMLAGLGIAYCQSTTDTEIWNGRITAKKMERVHCRHSYRCNCYTSCSGTGHSRSCHQVCQTCYEHSFDQDWNVYASTNESLSINTIDRQGLKMPPRWGAAYIGEPFSSSHWYTNYILANPESVLLGGKGDREKFKAFLPAYPGIYDYYKTPHFLNLGVRSIDQGASASWEWLLDEMNGTLGVQKQVQILLILVPVADPAYMLALKDHWIGGKKNDAVVVIGTSNGHKIDFADVLTWSPSAKYRILLRDELQKIGNIDKRDDIAAAISRITKDNFVRMEMKQYEYLVRSFQPSPSAMLFLFLFGTFGSIALAWFTVNNEVVDSDGRRYNRYYRRY
jgi:hypothetical protein